MARFNAHQQGVFRRLRAICVEGGGSARVRSRLAPVLTEALELDATCFMELDPEVVLPIHGVSSGWSAEAHALLLERVLLVSPVADVPRRCAEGLRTEDVERLSTGVRSDPYFTCHLLPFGYRHELLTLCMSGGAPRALLTCTRSARRGPFAPWHIRLLDALAPHVAAAVQRASVLETDLGSARGVAVVIAASGRMRAEDEAGERWIARARPGKADWLMAPGLAAASLRRGATRAMTVRDATSGVLHRVVAERPTADEPEAIRVCIEPIEAAVHTPTLRRFGLTDREAEIVRGLLLGADTDALAVTLRCAPATVRVHLHRVFDKLGVGSRAELAALLVGASEHAFAALTAGVAPAFTDAVPPAAQPCSIAASSACRPLPGEATPRG